MRSPETCSVFRLLLSMPIVDANCETLDKTLRSFRPCPASRREGGVCLKEGGRSAAKRASMRVVRDVNCKFGGEELDQLLFNPTSLI